MGMMDENEGLNVPKCRMNEFFADLEGKLALLTGLIDYKEFGLALEDVRHPMMVIGKPGIGKTAGIISIVEKLKSRIPDTEEMDENGNMVKKKQIGFKKILLGQTVVGSLSGIPVALPNGTVVRIQMPDLPDEERDGKYGILFLDEITTADEMQIQPALGLADDSRNIGEYTLPEGWIVVAGGNGPDCSNFVRLDDMTISRFSVYDINFDFKLDWRKWAHENNISPDILAYLSFKPEDMCNVESTDMDKAGKLFPCPRTWTTLSKELKIREAQGRPVDVLELPFFAGKQVGKRAGQEFAAFVKFKDKMHYDPKKILDGSEPPASKPLEDIEAYHLLVQQCVKEVSTLLKETVREDGGHDLEVITKVANLVKWFVNYPNVEGVFNSLIEFRDEVPYMRDLMQDPDFGQVCPEMDKFFEENARLIAESMEELNRLKF